MRTLHPGSTQSPTIYYHQWLISVYLNVARTSVLNICVGTRYLRASSSVDVVALHLEGNVSVEIQVVTQLVVECAVAVVYPGIGHSSPYERQF